MSVEIACVRQVAESYSTVGDFQRIRHNFADEITALYITHRF